MPFNGIPLASIWPAKTRSRSSSLRPSVDLDTVNDNFGLPSADDPDPFGVLALEKAGLQIREAGSRSRPTSDAFNYRPSPTSPAFRRSFQSIDGASVRDSKRNSRRSTISVDHGTQTADLAPSVAISEPPRVHHASMKRGSEIGREIGDLARIVDEGEEEEDSHLEEESEVLENVVVAEAEPAVQVVPRQAITSPRATHAKLVTIPKRPPPALPLRSPFRPRIDPLNLVIDDDDPREIVTQDDCSSSTYSSSPTKSAFDVNEDYSPNPWSALTSMQDSESVHQKDEGSPRHGSMDFSNEDEKEQHGLPEMDRQYLELAEEVGDGVGSERIKGETAATSQGADETKLEDASQTCMSEAYKDASLAMSVHEALQQEEINAIQESRNPKEASGSRDDASISSFYEEERQKDMADDDQFHSVPSTPVDAPL